MYNVNPDQLLYHTGCVGVPTYVFSYLQFHVPADTKLGWPTYHTNYHYRKENRFAPLNFYLWYKIAEEDRSSHYRGKS